MIGRKGYAGDRGFGCRTASRPFHSPREWGVRIGETRAIEGHDDAMPRGWWLDCDEAEELAQHILACVAWSQAQGLVGTHEDAA